MALTALASAAAPGVLRTGRWHREAYYIWGRAIFIGKVASAIAPYWRAAVLAARLAAAGPASGMCSPEGALSLPAMLR